MVGPPCGWKAIGGMPTAMRNGTLPRVLIGADTGGTFTDLVRAGPDGVSTWKVLSTPDDFSRGVLDGLRQILPPDHRGHLVHASTVATNALLERKGATTALITTRGFRDVLAIGRQARPELFNLRARPAPPLVPGPLRLEVAERVSAEAQVLEALDMRDVEAVLDHAQEQGAESVAVCLLFSFLHPEHERAIGRVARARGLACSLSSEIAPEFREYERTSTTVVNAYLTPLVASYLRRLEAGAAKAGVDVIRIVHSNGGSLSAGTAAGRAVQTLLSGPAAGVLGARAAARQALGEDAPIITFDMGGTSTDVSLQHGALGARTGAVIDGMPIQMRVLDIHTVGAGGGSIAVIDAGGALRVGPDSAGADPGPACFGRGDLPTVTDANVVLERIDGARFLGGRMALDRSRSEAALERVANPMEVDVAAAARAMIEVANAAMERAIRVVSVRRGHDPRGHTLVAFGGAGGLHACALAEALAMTRVLVPADPGVLSAWGAAGSDVVRDTSRTVMKPLDDAGLGALRGVLAELRAVADREMLGEGFSSTECVAVPEVDLRYTGQSYELTVPMAGSGDALAHAFHAAHERRYSHSAPGEPIQIVTARLRTIGRGEGPERPPIGGSPDIEGAIVDRRSEHVVLDREKLGGEARFQGPALVVEPYATTHVPAGWSGRIDRWGHMHLAR